jgi:hypothetical protein
MAAKKLQIVGSNIRLRPAYRKHVFDYELVYYRAYDGTVSRSLNILNVFTRECLAIRLGRELHSTDVIEPLTDLLILRGIPA